MNKTIVYLAVIAVLFFAAVWYMFVETSVLPMAVLASVLMVALRYVIDRWGFGKIDTIHLLIKEADNGNSSPYIQYMWQYTLLIVAGFFCAHLALN